MATTPVSSTSLLKDTSQSTNRTPKTELGKDEFLQILATQLGNQDPMSPMSDTDFIAQMAQFSSLEQMQQIGTSMDKMNASTSSSQMYSMIGKDVYANVTDNDGTTKPIVGRVTGVVRDSGTDYLVVGDYMIPIGAVIEVADSGTTRDGLLAQAANLVGKTIEGKYNTGKNDDKNNPILEDVTGEVTSIIDRNGVLYAKIKGSEKEVMISEITKVYTTPQASADSTTG